SLHFFHSGQDAFDPATTCRNTGEIAEVMDHEWGHWFDDYRDGNSMRGGEAEGDIVALYRSQSSCLGDGFFVTNSTGCGVPPDGTGYNPNMAANGLHCATSCSGVRDADWAKHLPDTPDDFSHFVRHECLVDPNDIQKGFEEHCWAAPIDQAAW